MKKLIIFAAIGFSVMFVFGCSSNPSGNFNIDRRNVTIITDPAGAHVTQINVFDQPSTDLGTAPINDQPVVVVTDLSYKNMPYTQAQQLLKASGGNLIVRIEKEGYQTYNGVLATTPAETVTHNIKLQKE